MQEILDGMARALYVVNWADREESEGREYPGQDLMDVAPDTPQEALDAAWYLAGMYEQANGTSVICLADRAGSADGVNPPDWDSFGHYLAMMALGHGVSWFDSHAEFPLTIPDFDTYLFLELP